MYNKKRIELIVKDWVKLKTGIELSDDIISKMVDDITSLDNEIPRSCLGSVSGSLTSLYDAKPVLSAGTVNLVELFAGSRSIGKVGDELGMNVFSVDWQKFENINLAIDIGEMKTSDVPFVPDVVWASPDCTTYSIAACSTHRTNSIEPKSEYAKKCDQVNQHFIGLIKEWLKVNPDMVFFIENPRGMLRKMPFMQEFKRHTIWYCQYGDDRAKPTDIWTNSKDWQPRPICHNGNKNCHHQPAPRGSKTGTQGRKGSYERSKIPRELCLEVLRSACR